MFVELHILQNFAPSNLNRDDTGAPKDCEFGGWRRARISSQCLKRAIRRDGTFVDLLAGKGGVRTRRLIVEVAERLSGQKPAPDETVSIIADVFKEGGIGRAERGTPEEGEKDTTKLILFIDADAIDRIVGVFRERWESLQRKNTDAKAAVVREIGRILSESAKVPDIALFGRMIEISNDKPFGKAQLNVDAACQVAHAISTHKVNMDFDFFTAVDDLPGGETGAGMMDTVGFNSACFYRYANVDLRQLLKNLQGDERLAGKTLEAFLRASVEAVPTGKQNSTAAQNPPSLVFAVVRNKGLWSLANAFVRPVRPDGKGDLVQNSIRELDRYWGKLVATYGEDGIVGKWLCGPDLPALEALSKADVEAMEGPGSGMDKLIRGVMGAARFDAGTDRP